MAGAGRGGGRAGAVRPRRSGAAAVVRRRCQAAVLRAVAGCSGGHVLGSTPPLRRGRRQGGAAGRCLLVRVGRVCAQADDRVRGDRAAAGAAGAVPAADCGRFPGGVAGGRPRGARGGDTAAVRPPGAAAAGHRAAAYPKQAAPGPGLGSAPVRGRRGGRTHLGPRPVPLLPRQPALQRDRGGVARRREPAVSVPVVAHAGRRWSQRAEPGAGPCRAAPLRAAARAHRCRAAGAFRSGAQGIPVHLRRHSPVAAARCGPHDTGRGVGGGAGAAHGRGALGLEPRRCRVRGGVPGRAAERASVSGAGISRLVAGDGQGEFRTAPHPGSDLRRLPLPGARAGRGRGVAGGPRLPRSPRLLLPAPPDTLLRRVHRTRREPGPGDDHLLREPPPVGRPGSGGSGLLAGAGLRRRAHPAP